MKERTREEPEMGCIPEGQSNIVIDKFGPGRCLDLLGRVLHETANVTSLVGHVVVACSQPISGFERGRMECYFGRISKSRNFIDTLFGLA